MFHTHVFSAEKTEACAACAAHFYGELRSVAEQVVFQVKRQARERRAEEGGRSSLCYAASCEASLCIQSSVSSHMPLPVSKLRSVTVGKGHVITSSCDAHAAVAMKEASPLGLARDFHICCCWGNRRLQLGSEAVVTRMLPRRRD